VAIEEEAFKPLGIEKKALREKLGLNGHNIISFIGRLNFAEKGIGWLLSALPAVVQSVPGATLVIIGGGGEMERIKRVCRELHIEPYVQLVGKKPLNELVAYLNASDVFVVPSLWMEAFGQVTIEAMSCGVPVVTSDAGASPEINKDNVSGMVVPVNDTNALSNAIITILKDETLKQRMGQAARARVIELYTYEVMVNRFLDIMQTLIH
jgi:glycosyltransferase involved in cell wall biosynthesis